jgi:hypothetical protein
MALTAAGPPVCPECGGWATYDRVDADGKALLVDAEALRDRAVRPVTCVNEACGWRGAHQVSQRFL